MEYLAVHSTTSTHYTTDVSTIFLQLKILLVDQVIMYNFEEWCIAS